MAIYHKTLQYHEDTTEKRSLNDKDIKFLMELQKEMNTQDTTETAEPRFWVIKGARECKTMRTQTNLSCKQMEAPLQAQRKKQ